MKEAEEGPSNKELYALLHISPEASDEEIRRAYRQWAQVYHPDKYQAADVLHFFFFFLLPFIIPTSCIFILEDYRGV